MLHLKTVPVLVALVFCLSPLSATQRSSQPPADNGFSAERLARVDRLLQQHVDENRIAGAVGLVLRDGRPVYEHAFGWSDKEAQRQMTVDTIFRIASQSKALTSVAILALMEEGRLSLSDAGQRVHSRLRQDDGRRQDGYGNGDGPGAARHHDSRSADAHRGSLVRHGRHGLCALRSEGPRPCRRLRLVHRRQGRSRVRHDGSPRVRFPSSLSPAMPMSMATTPTSSAASSRRASGVPLDRFIAERITTPLGMKDTRFFLPADQRARLATVYASGDGGTIIRAPEGPRGQGHTSTVRERTSPAAPACFRPLATTRASSR